MNILLAMALTFAFAAFYVLGYKQGLKSGKEITLAVQAELRRRFS
jgi:hypothetical protein